MDSSPFGFQRQRPIFQVMVRHDRIITGLFNTKNSHLRHLLPVKIKSVDFERFIRLYASVASHMGKHSTPCFRTQATEDRNSGFSTLISTSLMGFTWV